MVSLVFGIFLLTLAIFLQRKKAKWIHSCIKTNGIISSLKKQRVHDSHGTINYTEIPVVKFQYFGKEFYFENEVGGTGLKKGAKIEMYFNPEKPEDARIKSFFSLWILEFILAFIGMLFMLTGFIL